MALKYNKSYKDTKKHEFSKKEARKQIHLEKHSIVQTW
jgi:hypothetical protein